MYQGVASQYTQKLRRLGFLSDDEVLIGVRDNIDLYRKSGQVFWWTVQVILTTGEERTYVLKAPYDTFGDGITAFVQERAGYSELLRNAGVRVPRIKQYDRGTLIHEWEEGVDLSAALESAIPQQKESFIRQRDEIVRKCEELGLTLMDNHNGNFIVNGDGRVTLVDLDFIRKK